MTSECSSLSGHQLQEQSCHPDAVPARPADTYLKPVVRICRTADTAHQSNSTLLPIQYGPQPWRRPDQCDEEESDHRESKVLMTSIILVSHSVSGTHQDHDTVRLWAQVIFNTAVGHIQVVGGGRELGSQGVDLLHTGLHTQLDPTTTHHHLQIPTRPPCHMAAAAAAEAAGEGGGGTKIKTLRSAGVHAWRVTSPWSHLSRTDVASNLPVREAVNL